MCRSDCTFAKAVLLLFVRYLDSVTLLVCIPICSSLKLAVIDEQAGLSHTWLGTLKERYSLDGAEMCLTGMVSTVCSILSLVFESLIPGCNKLSFIETGHKIFSTAILSILLI